MGYLDKRLDNFQSIINEKFPEESPVFLLIDNNNMYRGRRRHDRLLKVFGPKMWKFTGRASLKCIDIITNFSPLHTSLKVCFDTSLNFLTTLHFINFLNKIKSTIITLAQWSMKKEYEKHL